LDTGVWWRSCVQNTGPLLHRPWMTESQRAQWWLGIRNAEPCVQFFAARRF
jgi:hypothetical protein